MNRSNEGMLALPDFKTFYKTSIVKTEVNANLHEWIETKQRNSKSEIVEVNISNTRGKIEFKE